MSLLERFLKYVSFDTRSDPESTSYPSTPGQMELLNYLAEELGRIGAVDVSMDKYGYVTATIPASEGYENCPVIGFLAHVDTSPDMSGQGIRPRLIRNYDGCDIALNNSVAMRVEDFPELGSLCGHDIIVTDGATLLGGDDKAGVAEIMTFAETLICNPDIPHGKIRIAFTPDEEIGKGVQYFDVKAFGADFAYTVDGGIEGELEYENFNASSAVLKVNGRNIHPGYAKDKMVNAITIAMEFDRMIPERERPEHTGGYQGFYHLNEISGTVEQCVMDYIIRDHSRNVFESRKQKMLSAASEMNRRYGSGTVEITLRDQYYNMREIVERHPHVIEKAIKAMELSDVKPIIKPIRGGTDGAQLSYKGLPCPNLFTGGGNFHGRFEYCSLTTMEKAVRTLVNLATEWIK